MTHSAHKIYFISDFHLGIPDEQTSRNREKKIVRWLEKVRSDASEIYILGDVFDFWFEYKRVVPKGFVRLLGKLAELSDQGIKLHYFTGNHDLWVFDYLPTEIGMTLYRQPVRRTIGAKKFFIGHGDGLGPGDHGYKLIKKIFSSRFCQWLFARIHPNTGIAMANYWSRKSRITTGNYHDKYLGDDKEFLVQFVKEMQATDPADYFLFGHRHLVIDKTIGNCRYVNLGDWLRFYTYAVFDGNELTVHEFTE